MMDKEMRENLLASGYNPDKVAAAWARGDFGWLMDYATGDPLRAATREEAEQSAAAGLEGAITVDGRTVYVQP